MEQNSQSLFSDPRWVALLESMKDTDRKMKETDRKMKETAAQIDKVSKEQEKTDLQLKKLENLFTTQWGKLIESLCAPASLEVFKKKGIGISQIYRSAARGESPTGHRMEVDVILCNTTVAVAVEVKTTCRVQDVDHFLDQMKYFKECFRPFASCTVYPAITALKYNEKSDQYALSKGLFVLYPQGDGMFTFEEPKQRREY